MSEHETDAGGERNLKKEAESIKREVFPPKETQKHHINFTSLASSKIPNFSLNKILGQRTSVTYVPDFHYVNTLLQKLFILTKQSKEISKIETCNIHSYTLYINYVLILRYFETIDSLNRSPVTDLRPAIDLLRSCGFTTYELPTVINNWCNALGKHTPIDIKRIFIPYLPNQALNGIYYDNYFWSANSAHLLPNFRLLQVLTLCYSLTTPLVIANPQRTRIHFLGNPFPALPQLAAMTEARKNALRIPGCVNVLTKLDDPDLTLEVDAAINTVHADPVLRYLSVTPNLLRHLKMSMNDLFIHIDHFSLSGPGTTGDTLVTIPLVHSINAAPDVPRFDQPPVLGAHATPRIQIEAQPSQEARIKSRYAIVNGDADIATMTPIVRVGTHDVYVTLDPQIPVVDPQHIWYTQEIEFQSPVFTQTESHAYFTKI